MSWQQPGNRVHRTLLDPPEDGIALSRSSSGWLGKRLRKVVDGGRGQAADRIRRGKNYALRGRARDLVINAGAVSADVFCDEVYRPSLRLTPLSSSAWRKVIDELSSDLSGLAALLEGELPETLVDRLASRGVSLVPDPDELVGDCDCGDWASPCTHVATLQHLVAEALDGDPFLLLTLRGRSMADLLSTLRERWGDDLTLERTRYASEEPVPDGDPYAARGGVPTLRSSGHSGSVPLAGLRALGPAPGGVDLLATLGPLYDAGRDAARAALEAVPDRVPPRRRPLHVVVEVAAEAVGSEPVPPPVSPPIQRVPAPPVIERVTVPDRSEPSEVPELSALPTVPPAAIPPPPPLQETPSPAAEGEDATGQIVAILVADDGLTSVDMAARLDRPVSWMRGELLELEQLGLVFRTKDGDTQRWWLG